MEYIIGTVIGFAISTFFFVVQEWRATSAAHRAEHQLETVIGKAADDLATTTTSLIHLGLFTVRAVAPKDRITIDSDGDGLPVRYQIHDGYGRSTVKWIDGRLVYIDIGVPSSGEVNPEEIRQLLADQKKDPSTSFDLD